MSKPILIGFFLVFIYWSSVQQHLRAISRSGYSGGKSMPGDAPESSRCAASIAFINFFQEPQPASGNALNDGSANQQDIGRTGFWLLIILVLIVTSLYTLYEIRKRQAISGTLDKVRSDLLTLYNNIPCGLHSVDERGVFLNVNQTLLGWLGYEKDEMIGKMNFSSIVDGGEQTTIPHTLGVGNRASPSSQLKLIKKSGEKMPVVFSVINMDGSGQSEKRLYCTVDNSECQDALERVRNLDQELEAFSYSISHDLRAPLRSIDGYSQILQEDYAGRLDDEGKRVLNVIMTNAKRMGKLIDDILEFGRLGRKSIQRANIDMTAVVNNIVTELRAQTPQRRIDVHVGRLHNAYGDADMIRQLWLNLLDNAFKYSGKQDVAVIEVRSFETGEREVCYEVVDNGVGFDMKYVSKLFGVFQRLHKIQDFTGTGVGLAMVKRIVSRHGGRVWAEGSLSHGAKFYFTIPIENEDA